MVEPLFLFNQFGDLERCILRPGHVHSAEDWRLVLEPVIARYRERGVDLSFRADAAFAKPEVYELLEAEGIRFAIRLPANQVLQERIGYLLKRPVGRPPKKPIVSYASFRYQVKGWTKARRVVAKVEWHQGELYPRVGFIVTNLARPAKRVVKFYNGRGRAEQHIKEGKNAIRWTRLSCHAFRHNAVRLQLHALAYNLANFLRTLALPADVEHWSLTTLREKLVKTGARIVRHGRYVVFQLAEVAVPRAPVRRDHASDRSAPTRTAPGMSIESKERNGNATGEVRPRSTEAPSKVTRTPLTRPEMGSVDGARPFDANSGCREPCFLGRRVRSSAFRDRHMGNIGKDDLAVRERAYSHVQPRCHAHGHAGSPKCVTLRPYGAGTGLEARDRATISLADRNPSQHEQETEMSESYSLATEPEGVVASLLERFNSGKVSAMMTLYEPEAVFIARDGRTVTDHTEIAAELERDISLGLPLEAKARHVFVAGDIAQIVLDWSIDGTGPDGEHVHLEGSASDIVRRGADGLWRYLIDNPRGTAVRQPV